MFYNSPSALLSAGVFFFFLEREGGEAGVVQVETEGEGEGGGKISSKLHAEHGT